MELTLPDKKTMILETEILKIDDRNVCRCQILGLNSNQEDAIHSYILGRQKEEIEKGKGMTYGVFNTTGDEVNSYGRPLTALELLRKKENDKKLALIRAEKKKRSEMYKSQNGSNQGSSSIGDAQNGLLCR